MSREFSVDAALTARSVSTTIRRAGRLTVFWRDVFTFEVYRCATGEVDFKGEAGERFQVRLVQNLPNRQHTLRLVAQGDGVITTDAFDVFEPPLK